MKAIDIALKDMLRSFRSLFAVVFMFGVPILTTLIFYMAFGGLKSDEGSSFSLPVTQIQVVNLDVIADPQTAESLSQNMSSMLPEDSSAQIDSLGDVMIAILQSEGLAEIIELESADTEKAAREAVEQQQAAAALIIPENFSQSLFNGQEEAEIVLYHDPDLTLGPGIVAGVVNQFVDSFLGAGLTIEAVISSLQEQGLTLDQDEIQSIVGQVVNSSENKSDASSELIEVISPREEDANAQNGQFIRIISTVMGGMMIFYAFFTSTATAQSLLDEEHNGTLPRLFTTPTPHVTILNGKFLSVALMVLVQISFLLLFAWLVFRINWGDLGLLSIFVLATVVAASGFGIFMISLIKNTRQAGAIYGGLVTVTGMLGIMDVFTMGASTTPKLMNIISRFVPQGWSMPMLQDIMNGAGFERSLAVHSGAAGLGSGFVLYRSGPFTQAV